jgi:hypothetical protein
VTFESLRRERVERIVEMGHKSSADKAAGPIMRIIRDLILPGNFRAAAKDGGEAMMWLQGHHIRLRPAHHSRRASDTPQPPPRTDRDRWCVKLPVADDAPPRAQQPAGAS